MSDCLLHLAALCLFDPSNVYVTAESTWQVSGDFEYFNTDTGEHIDGNRTKAAIGLLIPISASSFSLHAECGHYSFPSYGDRGEERCGVGFIWSPFRR